MAETVFKECEAEVSEPGEDDDAGEQDLEAVEVEAVKLRREAEEQVVHDGPDSGGGDSV